MSASSSSMSWQECTLRPFRLRAATDVAHGFGGGAGLCRPPETQHAPHRDAGSIVRDPDGRM